MRFNAIAIGLMAVILAGCAGSGGENPVASASPGIERAPVAASRHLWGIWDIHISADRQFVEVVPLRTADMHLNAVRLLETAPCTTCLTIENIHPSGPNQYEADVRLQHPFPGLLKYTGFDVRGIFIAQTDFTFPVSGRKIAWGDSVPRMLNPDGYTPLFNPTEFPPANPPALGYIPGKHSTGGDLNATLNPFMAYRKDAPRRMFEAGGSETRTVKIHAPTGPIHFGYAVDACWQLVDDVIDPLTDFPPNANCLEAYGVSVDLPSQLDSTPGSQAPVNVEVFDHQGIETISSVTIEAPDLFAGEVALAYSTQTGEESWLFTGTVTNETGMGHGAWPALARVVDTESDQNLGSIDAWQAGTIDVNRGWARTWGGAGWDEGYGVAVDGSGNAYVTGYFCETVDFDPAAAGVDSHTSNGGDDIFLSKFDSLGNFLWAKTWGGSGIDIGYDVAVDDSGNVYVTGFFADTVDFDPGSGVDNHISDGSEDVFLSKLDSSGAFQWAKTWGGAYCWDHGYGVAVDGSGNAYVTGYFWETVDFDPGSGVDNHTSNGSVDAFLSKFDSSGNFQWAKTWGGNSGDMGWGVAVDGSGSPYVTGPFESTVVDFDPGPGVDNHTTNGYDDVFLSKFDSTGNFLWAKTWGGSSYDSGEDVAVDDSGSVYVTGWFRGTADFDPGPGVDNHTSNGGCDVFLSKFDSPGNFQWAKTWGGNSDDNGWGVAVDSSGRAYVTGRFWGPIDFDPGPGEDNHSGYIDAFLSKFDSSGNFLWAKTWGGSSYDEGYGVAVDGSGNAYVTGNFCGTVDFDPGNGMDNHVSNGDADVFLIKFLPDGTW
jgi:hypothetical protein